MSDRCYPVLVFWSLGSLLLATGAALVIVTEETTGNVNITCNLDNKDLDVQRILKIGLRKANCNTLVSLVGSTISYGDANYADTNKYHASGSIEQEVGRSYLRLSILHPDQSESGVYTCGVGYLTKDMMFGQLQASSSLTVKGLYLKEMAKELSDLEDQLNQLESQEESQQEATNIPRPSVIAFAASLWGKKVYWGVGSTIVFWGEYVNEGNGYNWKTGTFTCPKSGFYQFHTTLHTYCDACPARVHILAGSTRVGSLTTTGVTHRTQVSVTGIAKVLKGEKVRVATRGGWTQLYGDYDTRLSVFSGFMLWAL